MDIPGKIVQIVRFAETEDLHGCLYALTDQGRLFFMVENLTPKETRWKELRWEEVSLRMEDK